MDSPAHQYLFVVAADHDTVVTHQEIADAHVLAVPAGGVENDEYFPLAGPVPDGRDVVAVGF